MLAAYWVSLSVRHKAQALALLLVVWFVAVLLYDLGLLVVTVAGADVLGRGTLTALMLANPASVFRLLNQSVIGVLSFEVPSACGPLGHSRRMDCGALRDLRKDARRPQAISSAEGRPGHEQESPVVPLQFVRQARRAFRRPSDRKPS